MTIVYFALVHQLGAPWVETFGRCRPDRQWVQQSHAEAEGEIHQKCMLQAVHAGSKPFCDCNKHAARVHTLFEHMVLNTALGLDRASLVAIGLGSDP